MNDGIDWTIVWYHNKIKRSYYRDSDGKVICRKMNTISIVFLALASTEDIIYNPWSGGGRWGLWMAPGIH